MPKGGSREPLELRVEYTTMNSFFGDYVRNIGQEKTFIRTDKPLAVGTGFIFTLIFPVISETLVIHGAVRTQITDDRAEHGTGMWIQFSFADAAEREAFHAKIKGWMDTAFGTALADSLAREARSDRAADDKKPKQP